MLPETLSKFTERTPTDRPALLQQLKTVGSSGYAIDTGEHLEDVRAVAVPISDYARTVVGAWRSAARPIASRPSASRRSSRRSS